MHDSLATSPADHVLGLGSDNDVFGLMRDLSRSRNLGQLVRNLNRQVLDGEGDERSRAIAALSRMGLWLD